MNRTEQFAPLVFIYAPRCDAPHGITHATSIIAHPSPEIARSHTARVQAASGGQLGTARRTDVGGWPSSDPDLRNVGESSDSRPNRYVLLT